MTFEIGGLTPPPAPERLDDAKVAAARLWAAHRFPYLASALFACKVVGVPGRKVVAVDPWWRLYLGTPVVDELAVEDLGTVLIHHIGHLLRDHAARARDLGLGGPAGELEGQARVFKKWVLAADIEINDDLVDAGLPLAADAVLPAQVGCQPGRLAEEYFHQLRADQDPCPECGSGAHAVPRDWDLLDEAARISPDAARLLRCQVADEVLKACRGQQPGTVPAGWERWARQLLEPKVDWRHVLAAELRQGVQAVAGAVDYTYRRPSRRARVVPRVVMPALQRPVPRVAIVCDTSGSMSEDLLGQVLAEVDGILRSVGVRRHQVSVVACDAVVQAVKRVTSARQVPLVGGGGTDMGAGIAAALELHPRPNIVVVLTDGFTPWPLAPPGRAKVVVGLLGPAPPTPPAWVKAVRIEDAA
ncbi:MAG: vWA domain-containing protein [Acidimicrobiales bacterium]